MKFETENISKNLKTISNLASDLGYLDVPNSMIYFASDKQALQIQCNFTEVKEDENKVFVVNKNDFTHITSFLPILEMDSDYHYKSEDGTIKGKFNHNEGFADVVDSIRYMFENKESYTLMATLDENLLNALTRAGIFVKGDDGKVAFQNLDILDNYLFSSSEFRIYLNKSTQEIPNGIIHADVLKFILQLGVGTEIYNNDDSYLLCKDNMSMYFSTMSNVDYLPVLEDKFRNKYMELFDKNKITFKVSELLSKLQFMSFYAKNTKSNVAIFNITNNEITMTTGEDSSIAVECTDKELKAESIRLPFNELSMLNIISKLGDTSKEVSLYVDEDDSKKLFILKFDEEELVIMSKINC